MKLKQNIAISESGLVFNPGSGESFTLNPIAVEIINKIKEGLSAEEISAWILANYIVDEATFERDFHDFINQLKKNGLVTKPEHEEKA